MRVRIGRVGVALALVTALSAGSVGAAAAAGSPAAPLPAAATAARFATPPAGYAAAAPGTILRSRPVRLAAFAALPQNVRAWQLLYRSTDSRGGPMTTVTTVLLPAGSQPRALVSYQIAQDSSAPRCAPSRTIALGGNPGEVVNQAELLLIDAAVAQGFAVSVPDYEGPRGEFGAAHQPGYAALDGLRAAEDFGPLGLPGRRTPTAAWGYSGGSLASGWVAQVQPRYAPDLDMRGIAAGGFVTDLAGALQQVNGGVGAGLIASVLPGVLRAEPPLARAVDPYLTREGRAVLARAGSQCEVPNVVEYAFTNLDRYLTVPLRQVLALPAVRAAMQRLNLGATAPTAPMYVYHAVGDELVPIAGADATVGRYCAGGTPVRYTRELLGEHGSLALTGAGGALRWLSDRLGGAPAPRGCSTTTVLSSSLSPNGLTGSAQVVLASLGALLYQPIGIF